MITAVNGLRSGGCLPSKDNLMVVKSSAGIYGVGLKKAMPDLVKLISLCEGKIIPAHTIKSLLQECTPNSRSFTRHHINNFRTNTHLLIKDLNKKEIPVSNFKC